MANVHDVGIEIIDLHPLVKPTPVATNEFVGWVFFAQSGLTWFVFRSSCIVYLYLLQCIYIIPLIDLLNLFWNLYFVLILRVHSWKFWISRSLLHFQFFRKKKYFVVEYEIIFFLVRIWFYRNLNWSQKIIPLLFGGKYVIALLASAKAVLDQHPASAHSIQQSANILALL